MANYHVSRKSGGEWQAEKAAKEFPANSGGGAMKIHGLDGKNSDSDTVKPVRDIVY